MILKKVGSYWDTRAEGFSLCINDELNNETRLLFEEMLIRCAPENDNLECLDIGCGPGFFSIILAQMGHSVTAFDYSEGMLEKADENFLSHGVSVNLQQGDAQNLPFEDSSFDYIVSRNLVWNLENPEKAYREWKRVLKPKGRMLIADANHYLHYYDEDYIGFSDCISQTTHKFVLGVDFSPINEIARDLPLSRKKRPSWDVEILSSIGFDNIGITFGKRRCINRGTEREKSLVYDFILCAEKPLEICEIGP